MYDEMTKADLLSALHLERSRWEALLAQVGEARMTAPVPASAWSIKDIIAHVAWHEQQTTAVLQLDPSRRLVRDWLWLLTAAKRNAILFTEYRDRPLPDVLADAQQVFTHLIAAVEALSEKDPRDPQRFPTLPPAWQPWHFIAAHSYEHYLEHMPNIRAWLDTQGPAPDTTARREVAVGAR